MGKTSLSFNLAVLRAKAGKPVLLVDADKQASSAMWASLRSESGLNPPLVCVQKSGKIGIDLLQLRSNYEVIVDAGGQDSVELRQAIGAADEWIIPVRPASLDLFSMAKLSQLLASVEQIVERVPRTRVVLNLVAASTTEADEARVLLQEYEEQMPVMDCQLIDRVAHRRAVKFSCGVTELPASVANPAATAETLAFYEAVFGEPYVEAA